MFKRLAFVVLMSAAASVAAQNDGTPAETPVGKPKSLKAGQAFKECKNCPDMIVVAAGTFTMGSPLDEPERRENEQQRPVTFARPFALARTTVTWDQWEACVRDSWCDGAAVDLALRTREQDGQPNPDYKDWGRGTRPVVGVSWFDAQTFVGWLNWKVGEDDAYRLPSEAEWEYAARAGTATAFPWGDRIDYDRGNFGDDGPGAGPSPDGKIQGRDQWGPETSPVASFPPNAWGFYDMHGNVFEWTADCFEADLAHSPTDGSANKEGNCANRVFRNGTYLSKPYMQRSARRGAPYPATRRGRNYLGFRVAKTLD
jgi:formylglycine-generating enzyme required for sulfatase activity